MSEKCLIPSFLPVLFSHVFEWYYDVFYFRHRANDLQIKNSTYSNGVNIGKYIDPSLSFPSLVWVTHHRHIISLHSTAKISPIYATIWAPQNDFGFSVCLFSRFGLMIAVNQIPHRFLIPQRIQYSTTIYGRQMRLIRKSLYIHAHSLYPYASTQYNLSFDGFSFTVSFVSLDFRFKSTTINAEYNFRTWFKHDSNSIAIELLNPFTMSEYKIFGI